MSGIERMNERGEPFWAWAVRGWPDTAEDAEANRISEKVDPVNPPRYLEVTGTASVCTVVVVCLGRILGAQKLDVSVIRGDMINLSVTFRSGPTDE